MNANKDQQLYHTMRARGEKFPTACVSSDETAFISGFARGIARVTTPGRPPVNPTAAFIHLAGSDQKREEK